MCDIFRKNYRECFEQHGARQCRAEIDELFKCIYEHEFKYSHIQQVFPLPIGGGHRTRISCPSTTTP